MDIKKQPGINFKSIIMVSSNFYREADIPKGMEIEIDIKVSSHINEQQTEADLDLIFTIRGIKDDIQVLRLESRFIGYFESDGDSPNMNLNQFLNENAPALMFPYIREYVSNTTSRAGISPIIIPPINILALIKESEQKN